MRKRELQMEGGGKSVRVLSFEDGNPGRGCLLTFVLYREKREKREIDPKESRQKRSVESLEGKKGGKGTWLNS